MPKTNISTPEPVSHEGHRLSLEPEPPDASYKVKDKELLVDASTQCIEKLEWLVTQEVITGCCCEVAGGDGRGGVSMRGNEVIDWSDVKFYLL